MRRQAGRHSEALTGPPSGERVASRYRGRVISRSSTSGNLKPSTTRGPVSSSADSGETAPGDERGECREEQIDRPLFELFSTAMEDHGTYL